MPFDQYGNYVEDAPLFGDPVLSQPNPLPPEAPPPLFPQPTPGPQMFLDQGEFSLGQFAPAPPAPPQPDPSNGGFVADIGNNVQDGLGSLSSFLTPSAPAPVTAPAPAPVAGQQDAGVGPAPDINLGAMGTPINFGGPVAMPAVAGTRASAKAGQAAILDRAQRYTDQANVDNQRQGMILDATNKIATEEGAAATDDAIKRNAIQQKYLADSQAAQQRARVEAEARVSDIKREVEAFRSMHVSQGDAMRKLGTIGNAANALAVFGEVFMQAKYGIKTGASAAIDGWMNRELETQKANIAHQGQVIGEYKNLYDLARQTSQDEEEARDKFKLMQFAALDSELNVQARKFQSRRAMVDYEAARANLASTTEKTYLDILTRTEGQLDARGQAEAKQARANAQAAHSREMAVANAKLYSDAEAIYNDPNSSPQAQERALATMARTGAGNKGLEAATKQYAEQYKGKAEAKSKSTATPAVFGSYEVGTFKSDLTTEERAKARELGSDHAAFMVDLNNLQDIIDRNGGPDMLQGKLGSTDQAVLEAQWQKVISTRGHAVSGSAMSEPEFQRIQKQVAGDPSFFSRASNAKILHNFVAGTIDGMDSKMASYIDFYDQPVRTGRGSIVPSDKARQTAIGAPAGELSDNARQAAALGQRYPEGDTVSAEDVPSGIAPLISDIGAAKRKKITLGGATIVDLDTSSVVYDTNLQTIRSLGQRAANGDLEALTALRAAKTGTEAEDRLRDVVVRYVEKTSGAAPQERTAWERATQPEGFVDKINSEYVDSLADKHSDALFRWLTPDVQEGRK